MIRKWCRLGLMPRLPIWQDDTSQVKAKPVTAQAGLAGQSPNGEADENLVGRIPKTPARSTGRRKKE